MKGSIVKRACKELGINQKELAERLGITPSAVSNWANDVPKTAQLALELMVENNQLKKYANNNKVMQAFDCLPDNLQKKYYYLMLAELAELEILTEEMQ